jgi:hypothetical protein
MQRGLAQDGGKSRDHPNAAPFNLQALQGGTPGVIDRCQILCWLGTSMVPNRNMFAVSAKRRVAILNSIFLLSMATICFSTAYQLMDPNFTTSHIRGYFIVRLHPIIRSGPLFLIAAMTAAGAVYYFKLFRSGVLFYLTQDGIQDRGMFGMKNIPWDKIEKIEPSLWRKSESINLSIRKRGKIVPYSINLYAAETSTDKILAEMYRLWALRRNAAAETSLPG